MAERTGLIYDISKMTSRQLAFFFPLEARVQNSRATAGLIEFIEAGKVNANNIGIGGSLELVSPVESIENTAQVIFSLRSKFFLDDDGKFRLRADLRCARQEDENGPRLSCAVVWSKLYRQPASEKRIHYTLAGVVREDYVLRPAPFTRRP
ncbi:MAG: hypothetical protein HY921_01300 [Elusimicrobia bacterium]|nr:hypothetical protein [Elusimicrobiota bacterium]